MLLEMAILVTLSVAFDHPEGSQVQIACALLFAMGVQNALVTKISNATVRTTHLTGLFTDLGIECSQLFFHREKHDVHRLTRSIYLRLAIILFFFLGGVIGGFAYQALGLKALLLSSAFLMIAFLYDSVRLTLLSFLRKR